MTTSALAISVLGPLQIQRDDRLLRNLGSGKLAALFAYLVCEPGQHRRETLADLFWPGLTAEAARLNLRQALFQLRGLLTDGGAADLIAAGRQHLALNADVSLRLDLAAFTATPTPYGTPGSTACPDCLARAEACVATYRGPFLSDLSLPDCPGFEDWQQFKRESLHRRALDLLLGLVDCHEQAGEPQRALPFALRHVELEPWSEIGYLRAMQLLAQLGRREAALAHYAACRRVLERELGVLPGTELRALADEIRRGTNRPDARRSVLETPTKEERREVAVLYCELAVRGVADASDAEDALPRLDGPQASCEAIVRRWQGHVVRAYGGGLLAYFGYPGALENSVLAAVRAAREIVAALPTDVAARLAVHLGPIIVGGAARVPDPVGTTTTGAIHLHRAAAAGDVLVSESAGRRIAGYYRLVRLSPRQARVLPRGLTGHRVVAETGATHRLAAAVGLTPFVGRSQELEQLDVAWNEARQGRLRAVMIIGEAGIGKSRLAHTLVERVSARNALVRELRCFPETQQSPLRPIITLFESLCGHISGDGPLERLEKLRDLLSLRAPSLLERGLPLLARLLDLPEELAPPPDMSAEALRTATHGLLIDLFLAVTAKQPTLLLVEDLHWADGATRDLLIQLHSRAARAPALLLLTLRPDATTMASIGAEWPAVAPLELAPLPDAVIAAMLDKLGTRLEAHQRAAIVARADGIPLYLEELVAAGGKEGLPDNLHDLLRTRLDRLAHGLGVAQLAACIGREFAREVLAGIGRIAPEDLERGLAELCASGLVQALADGRFQFKHALVGEAAYATQTRAGRRAAHRAIAEWLEQDGTCHAPETRAHHWQAANVAARAIPYWHAAGQHAAAGYHHREAIAYLTAGLRLLEQQPASGDRDRQEFALRLDLARSEQEVFGYGSEGAVSHLSRAIALHGAGAGTGAELFAALWGLWEGASSRVGYQEGVRLAHQLVTIATAEAVPVLMWQARYALGNSLFWSGDFVGAETQLESALHLEASAEGPAGEPARDCYGRILTVAVRAYLSVTWWLRGQPAALDMSEESLALARRIGDPNGCAFALTFATSLRRWMGDREAALHLAKAGQEAAAACQSAVFSANFSVIENSLLAMAGDLSALGRVETSINTIRVVMSGIAVPALAPFAEALVETGAYHQARDILAEAIGLAERKHDRHYLAELYRLEGLCLERLGEAKGARERYALALTVAERQGASALAARAKRSLALP